MQIQAADFVATKRYPIDQTGPALDALVAEVPADLETHGCAVLSGFVRADRIDELVAECDRVAVHGHRNFNRTNAYFTQDRPELPTEHPLRRFQAALGEASFHRYGDLLADGIVNLAVAGNGFPWHFDTNNYTVTLAIQNAESGGEFEYSPHLRTVTSENYTGVQAVLDGDRRLVRTLRLQPGDLQIFKGRYSLHRVTPLAGQRPRYVAIFSYAEQPDMVGSSERARQLYGRVLPIHLERAGLRSDKLID